MNHTKKSYSMIQRIAIGLSVIYLFLIAILMINNIYTFRILHQNISNQLTDALSAGNRQITSELNNASTYLATMPLNAPDIMIVEQNKEDSTYYTALHNVQTSLSTGLSSMSLVEGLFVFPTSNQQFIYQAGSTSAISLAKYLTTWCRIQYGNGTIDSYVSKYWFSYEANDDYYLVKILKIGSSYVGAWTTYARLLSYVETPASLNTSIFFSYNNEETYNAVSRLVDFTLYPETENQHSQSVFLDENYLAVYLPAKYTEHGYIYLLTSYANVSKHLLQTYLLSIFSIGLFLLMAIITFAIFQRFLRKPIANLEGSLVALRDGDFSIRLSEEANSREFNNVNCAFNEMVSRIEDLKISVYEKKIEQQHVELQALKNQIAPHFLINCLNSIYHMSMAKNLAGIQYMVVFLGDHLRYALANVTYVPLQTELEKVNNYIELSKIRFPNCIELSMENNETHLDAMVPPMVLLFQVENIVKYEVVNGEITEIHIEIKTENADELSFLLPSPTDTIVYFEKYIHFTIWDTGTGYATTVLKQLQNPDNMNQSDGHNIGTRNIFKRLDLLFDGHFHMDFSNRPNAGAQVDIWIPYQQTVNDERKMI